MLTVDEAVQYFGIGEKKIRMLISENTDTDIRLLIPLAFLPCIAGLSTVWDEMLALSRSDSNFGKNIFRSQLQVLFVANNVVLFH